MGKVNEIIKEDLGKKVIDLYNEYSDIGRVAKELNLSYGKVHRFVATIKRNTPMVIDKCAQLAKENLKQNIDAYGKLVEKISEIEGFITQLKTKDENGNDIIDLKKSKEYLAAWQSVTGTLQWWMEKRMALLEAMEGQIFRQAIIEAIKGEYPSVAQKIKDIVDKKRKELGII